MSITRKYWRIILVSGLFAITASGVCAVLWAGQQIASPTRRPILDYHRDFLTNPAEHGLQIKEFTTSEGTPCLVCEPSGRPGNRGTKIRMQLVESGLKPPRFGQITGTIVLLHGRRGRKEDSLPIAERLCAAGFRCVIPDLPAHGDHPGSIATYGVREAELPARILDETSRHFGFAKQPAGLIGMSMGGSVAIHAAAQPEAPWKALVIISSFDSFPAVIEGQASRHIGTSLGPVWAHTTDIIYQNKSGISMHAIQPRNHAPGIHIPTLVAHGTSDRIIPLSSGKRLFDSLPGTAPKSWLEIPGAGHDNVLITDFPIYSKIAGWMIRNLGQ
jgi:pimeloyl-ACP methyl ester carboxylesterase